MSLQEVFVKELRDLYSAENQLVKALPKMARASSDPDAKALFQQHLEQTKGQVERLKQIFAQLGKKPTGQLCKGMEGLIAEGQEHIEDDQTEGALKDLTLAGAALRVEHYEIAGYSAAIAMAKTLGQREAAELLTQTLDEEKETAKKVAAAARPLLKEANSERESEAD
jgi:ferritin-like metal-binding protein YciE